MRCDWSWKVLVVGDVIRSLSWRPLKFSRSNISRSSREDSDGGLILSTMRLCVSALLALTMPAAGVLLSTAPASAAPVAAKAEPSCSAFDDPVYQKVKPKNDASLLTASKKEIVSSGTYGFTEGGDKPLFNASTSEQPGLVEVHRLYRWKVQDFDASADPEEIARATQEDYTDQGTRFFASPVPADCLVPVYRYSSKTRHRFAVSAAEREALKDDGWASGGIAFYAAPSAEEGSAPVADDDESFSFAVYPDTQQEVGTDSRFINRTNWLVDHRDELNLQFVTHTGDVVNWDTESHSQYEVASRAMKPLESAHIPYSLAIGNHDTQATGPGGAARDPKNTRKLQRDTTTFNDYFSAADYGGVSGAFEKGKVDNVYSLYEAGGRQWMVLVLELWPRESVVDWAKSVVADHPDANVVVVTHDYLDPNGGIEQSAGYGDTSPQSLYDELISQYANVRMVLSGHVGVTAHRTDTGKHGNKIYSFMTTIHSGNSNPVRLFTVDTKAGTLKTRVYAPWTDQTWNDATETLTGIDWVG